MHVITRKIYYLLNSWKFSIPKIALYPFELFSLSMKQQWTSSITVENFYYAQKKATESDKNNTAGETRVVGSWWFLDNSIKNWTIPFFTPFEELFTLIIIVFILIMLSICWYKRIIKISICSTNGHVAYVRSSNEQSFGLQNPALENKLFLVF